MYDQAAKVVLETVHVPLPRCHCNPIKARVYKHLPAQRPEHLHLPDQTANGLKKNQHTWQQMKIVKKNNVDVITYIQHVNTYYQTTPSAPSARIPHVTPGPDQVWYMFTPLT